MAHHFEPSFTGGFLGVDVFFVLSGYVITSLLVDGDSSRGRISLLRFYARRALRLLPALLPLFALVTVVWVVRPYPSAFGPVGSMLVVVGYVGNWVVAIGHDGLGYLSHTWSLAIEEQFYVLWPLALIGLLPRATPSGVARGLALLVVWLGGGAHRAREGSLVASTSPIIGSRCTSPSRSTALPRRSSSSSC